MKRVHVYVTLVCLAALTCGYGVYVNAPVVSQEEITAVAVLAGLAALAEFLTFVLPHASQGSLAFIPYLAAVMVVPSWAVIAAATLVKLLAESCSRREWAKKAFNTSQLTLTLTAAVVTYRGLGGDGMLTDGIDSLAATTTNAGLAALSAFVIAFAVNTLLVQGVVSLASGVRFARVVRENVGASLSVDLLASPIVFLFAWLYATYGSIAAVAIWVPILGVRQLTRAKLELEQTNQELLELMVRSIEARDAYTSGHSRRVSDYAQIIARAIGSSEKQVELVRRAALLHDVGKIHEKYAPILAKPEKLTPDEWRLMQQHPVDGANLIATMTRLRDLIPAVKHHHEQWDGSGYPTGMAGEDIPLAARIIALADTVDAMTSERPYRHGMTADQVRAELIRCRGKQFDPQIVDRLLASPVWNKLFMPSRAATPYGSLAIVNEKATAGLVG